MRFTRFWLIVVAAIVLAGTPLKGDGVDQMIQAPLDDDAEAALLSLLGNVSDAQTCRVSVALGVGDIVSAIYGTDRALRLVALDAAGYSPHLTEMLPFLAAFMRAPERQAASTAAASMVRIIARVLRLDATRGEMVDAQVGQLRQQLQRVIGNPSLEVDIRIAAINVVNQLRDRYSVAPLPLSLLNDEDAVIRSAALSALQLPLSDEALEMVASAAKEEANSLNRGMALAILCENAVYHDVSVFSEDYQTLLNRYFKEIDSAEGLAVLMGCFSQMSHSVRADLSDRVASQNDKVLKEYWKKILDDKQ